MLPAHKIWMNGKIVSFDQAKIFPFNQGLNYGACVYEGIKFYKTKHGPAIFRLKDHLNRFWYSAKTLRMPLNLTKNQLTAIIKQLVKVNKLQSGYIRPLAFYSEPKMGINILSAPITFMILLWPWREQQKEKQVRLKITKYQRLDPNSVDLKAKIAGYYAGGLLGFIEAREAGFDEPLFLDKNGNLAEGAINNIFIVKNKILYTSSAKYILSGITRQTILQLAKDLRIRVKEGDLKPSFLKNADEIFLTGTGIELEKVIQVDKIYYKKDDAWPITEKILKYYRSVATGQIKKHASWLTLVK